MAKMEYIQLEKNSSKHADNDRRGHCFAMNCREYDCGAHLVLRKVAFSDSGYEWGLFGCMTHSHEEKLNNRMELVFDNYNSAMEFHNHYFEPQYKKSSGSLNDAKNYGIYTCRRTTLEGKHGDGKCPCDSKIHFKLAFVHMTGKDNEEAKNHPSLGLILVASLPKTVKISKPDKICKEIFGRDQE